MELTEPASYKNKKLVIKSNKNTKGYDCYTLAVDLNIYRGEHGERKEPGKDAPAFFSDMVSAAIYTRGNSNNLFIYKVKKAPILFHLSYENLIKLYDEDERLTDDEKAATNMYLQVSEDLPPYIVPVAFLKKKNATIEPRLYLNRRMINTICRLGFDGWIAMPETLLQRNMDTQHYQESGEIRYRLNLYNPEIAICKWDEFLEKQSNSTKRSK